jgi:hypothetical protein
MAPRAWRVWGMSAVLAGGLAALAQSPKPEINGRATPAITQDYFQPEAAPPPRLLPQAVRDWRPSKLEPPTAVNVAGRESPVIQDRDLDIPVRVIRAGSAASPSAAGDGLPADWKARAALDVAEMYFDACDTPDARAWYEEVIKLAAPDSKSAAAATERLNQIKLVPAGGESSEPPLADANRGETQVRIH